MKEGEGREGRRERIEGGGERGGMDVQGTDDDRTLSVYRIPSTRHSLLFALSIHL